MAVTKFTLVLGVVLLGLGIVGMMTGGHPHQLLIFGINAGHNLVHVASGALAIIAALSGARAATVYCLGFGSVYGLVAVLGFFNVTPIIRLLHLNMPDNFLHLAIACACLWIGGSGKEA